MGAADPNPTAADDRLTIDAFQALIRERYYESDAARGAAATFVLLVEEVGELARALHRTGKPTATDADRANLEEEFADVLAWLTTLANVSGVDLERALGKYTGPGRVEGVK